MSNNNNPNGTLPDNTTDDLPMTLPPEVLLEMGVTRTTEETSVKKQRKQPRRSGKVTKTGSAKSAVIDDRYNGVNTAPVNTELDTYAPAVANKPSQSEDLANFGGEKTLTGKRIIDFMKVAKPFAILSLVLTLLGLGAIITKGLNLGLDFTGGVSATVVYDKPVEQSQIQSALASKHFDDSQVQYLGSNKEVLLRLPPQKTIEGLSTQLDTALDLPSNNATIKNLDIIGSQVGNEIYLNSIMAMALALLCMFIYVTVRFQSKLALGAVLALFHDSIITVGIFALFGWPFDLTVLAAILSLIGYSLNDTIVVFDRIRENFRRVRDVSARQIVNLSLTETLRRTIMTVSTVLLVVLAMLFLGGPSLYWFALALCIGLVLGTFSSVYIASAIPLWMGMSRKDFIVQNKPEFTEEEVIFSDKNAPIL